MTAETQWFSRGSDIDEAPKNTRTYVDFEEPVLPDDPPWSDYFVSAMKLVALVGSIALVIWLCVLLARALDPGDSPEIAYVASKGIRAEKQYNTECSPQVGIDFNGNITTRTVCRPVFSHWEDVHRIGWIGCTRDSGGVIVPLREGGTYKVGQLIGEGKSADNTRCTGVFKVTPEAFEGYTKDTLIRLSA